MAEQNTKIINRWAQFAQGIILSSGLALLFILRQTRLIRSAKLDVPFVTDGFAAIGILALMLIIITTGLVISGKLKTLLTPLRFWIWLLISTVGLIVVNGLIPAFSVYLAAFLAWLIIVDAGLSLLVYSNQLSQMNFSALIRNFSAIAVGVAITLLMLEILLRVYFGFFGTEIQRVSYVYSIAKILEVSNRYEGLPYVNYGLSTNHREHNSRGYRGAEFNIPKDDATYRIFTLGGSTTYGEGILPEQAYPALLQEILHEEYGYTHVEVVNAGVNAYSSFDSLANLTYHVLDDEPDMLIIYHGVNDVRARLVDPQYYSGANLQRGYWNPRILEQSLSPSVLLRFIRVQLGISFNPAKFENMLGADGILPRCGFFEVTCPAVDNRPAADILAENPPEYFERNLLNIEAIASANNVGVMYSTWLYYPGELDLPNPMTLEHMQNAVDEQNALIRDTGSEMNIPVIDFASTDTLNSPEYWIDGMHMTAPGAILQAEFYAAYLIENELLPPPPEN